VVQFCLSLLALAQSRQAKTILRLEKEDGENKAASSLLAPNLHLASDLCLTFTSLRSGRSKEVTGHLAIGNRFDKYPVQFNCS
jgi:hypothetical protein